ncbi:MAG: NADase-type glycan-binding domain-containing protein [Myxococcota bacterium]
MRTLLLRPAILLSRLSLPLACTLLAATAWAGVSATSQLVTSTQPASTFAIQNLIDGDLKTVWVEGKAGSGEGESFTLDLPRAEIKKLVIFPGHSADERMCKKYARVKEVSVTFYTITDKREEKIVKQQNATFEDACKFQEIPVEGVKVGEELFGGKVTVTLRSVYPGGDFQDTAIGEARVALAEFAAQTNLADAPAALKGTSKDNLLDGSPKTPWVSEAPLEKATFVIDAPDFGLAAVNITAGDTRDPKKPKPYARPKDVVVEVSGYTVKATLKDDPGPQRIDLPTPQGYTGSVLGQVKITVESVYPGTVGQNLSISEIQLLATHYSI